MLRWMMILCAWVWFVPPADDAGLVDMYVEQQGPVAAVTVFALWPREVQPFTLRYDVSPWAQITRLTTTGMTCTDDDTGFTCTGTIRGGDAPEVFAVLTPQVTGGTIPLRATLTLGNGITRTAAYDLPVAGTVQPRLTANRTTDGVRLDWRTGEWGCVSRQAPSVSVLIDCAKQGSTVLASGGVDYRYAPRGGDTYTLQSADGSILASAQLPYSMIYLPEVASP